MRMDFDVLEQRARRQLEGTKAAKARAIHKGRKPGIDPDELRRCGTRRGSGLPPSRAGSASGDAGACRVLGKQASAV